MKLKSTQLLALGVLTLSSFGAHAAGFQEIQLPDPGHPDLTVGVWYPSEEAPPSTPNTRFGRAVALNAPIGEVNSGLVLISHGFSGWYAGHADTAEALADRGYIVAAPTHTGNTWSDMSSSIDQWLIDRPRHISRVIDGMLQSEKFARYIDKDKIGLYGFSAGGFTGLSLVGGVLDPEHAKTHCEKHPDEYACASGFVETILDANMQHLPDSAWGADSRISAASLSAPGFAFAYPQNSLANVKAEIQLWSGELDTSVPTATNAALLAKRLPAKPDLHVVANANHFAFLIIPCREAFKREDPDEYEMVCGDKPGFDRAAFHASMHEEMINFFDSRFGISQ